MIDINKKEEPSAQPGQSDAITNSAVVEHKSAHPTVPKTKIWTLVATTQAIMEHIESEWEDKRASSHSADSALQKCTMTNKAYNKRKAKNKMAKLSRRANRRKK
jgi:hypothetical protein